MSRLLMYGIKQQRRKVDLGFEPYVAPAGFDRTAQDIDIYDVFNKYYKTNSDAKWIYSVDNSFTTNYKLSADEIPTYGGTSYRWGYQLGGVSYTVDCPATTTPVAPDGTYTSITVASTAGFPDAGKINIGGLHVQGWSRNPYFTYTSKDATHFYGTSQVVNTMGAFDVNPVIAWPTGSTKRWVIVNHTSTTAMVCTITNSYGPSWLYCGNLINSVFTSSFISQCTIKYIHVDKLSNITRYISRCHQGSPLTGILYLSGSVADGYLGDYFPGYSEATSIFANCTSLTGTLTIPSGAIRISYSAFIGCTGFTALDLGDTVTTILAGAFSNLTGCTGTLTIPASVTTISSNVFTGSMFTDVVSNSSNFDGTDYVLYDISSSPYIKANYSCKGRTGALTFRNDTTEILQYCCYNNTTKTGTLTIPSTVTDIGNYAFYTCSGFTGNLVFPNSLLTIGDSAFWGFRATGTLTFGNSITTIANNAFRNVRFTGNLTIPDSVTTIGNSAFSGYYYGGGWAGAYNLTIGNGAVTIGQGAFSYQGFTGTLTLGNSIVSIVTDAFAITPFSSITSSSTNYPAEDSVLYDCKTVGKVKAFYGAVTYTGTLTLKTDTTDILANCFYKNLSRTGNLSIPNTVTDIASEAFYGCSGLNGTLTVGSGLVTMVSVNQFYNTNFSSITSSSTNYPAEDNVLYDVKTAGQVQAIIGAKGYSGTLTLKTGTTKILANCFYSHTNRSGTLVLLSSVTHINGSGFKGCNNFTRVDSYPATAPVIASDGLNLGGTARALHIPTGGGTGYGVAPWTTAAIFTQPAIADL